MKNIVKISLVALLASGILSGCIKETFPTSVATAEQMSSSSTATKAMVNGMAAFVNNLGSVNSDYAYDWGYPAIGMVRDVMGEDVATVASGYEWFNAWMKNQYQGDSYVYGQFIWNFYTKFLLSANSVISAINPETASDLVKSYLGMAYCYRAMINLDMGRMYEFKKNNYTSAPELEGMTIPIIKENMTEAEARKNPRVSKETLLNELIIPDLTKAIEYLKSYKRSQMNEPDLSVAYGLLARAYMWAEDYSKAQKAAEDALAAGKYSPLSESQWTSTTTGFNSSSSQSSWMWASILTKEDDVVKTGILNFASWMCSETSFGYACAGPFRLCDAAFYNNISDTDFRKKSWVAPEGSTIEVPMIGATSSYDPTALPELAQVKFRPGSGDPDDYNVGAVVDYPLMRCEEMMFIIAECEARKGNLNYLTTFMTKYRDASYSPKYADDLVKEVIFQKRIEFWGEGIIFFDFKRLNMSINRGYTGTNHIEQSRFNTNGLAPWMNLVVVRTENMANSAFITNPDPSDTVTEWSE